MQDVIKLYCELRSVAEKNGNELAHHFSVRRHEDPSAFFSMAFNSLTMTLELLDHYYNLWGKLNPASFPDVEETKKQNTERIILLQKMCFVEIMSSFEFSAKKIVSSNSDIFGTFNGRIYLSGIMRRSLENLLLNENQLNLWKGAIYLRNALVHNNGIAEEDCTYDFPDATVILRKDAMTQGDLRLFGMIIKWLLDESKDWIKNANPSLHGTR